MTARRISCQERFPIRDKVSYAKATDCVPERCFVAGTMMQPFSLGHHLLLSRLCIPLADHPAAECSQDELLIAVAICGKTYSEGLSLLLSGEWEDVVKRWLKKVRKGFKYCGWDEIEGLFRAYLADGYRPPPTMQYDTVAAIKFTAPWEQLLKVRLIMAGFSEDEVLNGYLPARWYDYFTVCELRAADKISNQQELNRFQDKQIFYTKALADRLKEVGNG